LYQAFAHRYADGQRKKIAMKSVIALSKDSGNVS
jgi:hypothetical protein